MTEKLLTDSKNKLIFFFSLCLQDTMKAAETALQEVNKELAKLEDEETVLQKDVVDVKNELEKFQNIVKENQQKIKHWKKEVFC